MINTNRVLKPRMSSTRVNLLGEGELPYSLKAEKRGVGQNLFQRPAQWNMTPDGYADKSAVRLKKKVFSYHEISGVAKQWVRFVKKINNKPCSSNRLKKVMIAND
jgi:hypothetical protein